MDVSDESDDVPKFITSAWTLCILSAKKTLCLNKINLSYHYNTSKTILKNLMKFIHDIKNTMYFMRILLF